MVSQIATQGSLFDLISVLDYGQSLVNVASYLVKPLLDKRPLATKTIQAQMNRYFLGTAAEGAWQWKDAYEAVEVALILYLQRSGLPQNPLLELQQLETLCPTHTRRSEEQLKLQQFSTPLPLAYLVAMAGQINSNDLVLEPSAGTGILAQFAKLKGASLMLNELAEDRSKILRRLFPGVPLFGVNAEQINDYLAGKTQPSVVLMNPPFSSSPKVRNRNPDATPRHVNSALQRLVDGGRLVTITANWFSPSNDDWRETFLNMQEKATVVLSVGVNGKVYSKHGTQMDTRITVIDKVPAADPTHIACIPHTVELTELLELIEQLPTRLVWQPPNLNAQATAPKTVSLSLVKLKQSHSIPDTQATSQFIDVAPLNYEVVEWTATEGLKDALYESYRPQRVRIKDALPHPSLLCESAALALVSPPAPTYKPHLPQQIVAQGLLSEAQLESVVYAGQTHSEFLSGSYLVDDSLDNVTVAANSEQNAVRFRRGWFLGDGTGAGKGRQVAGIVLDNWCQGRRKAIWISKSSALIEDARRDWCALGGSEKDIIDLGNIKLGDPIPFLQGVLFATYSTLRSQKGGKSRLKQIIEWAGKEFDGAIAFDECHSMGNAMAQEGKLGMVKASMQGIVGLRLQNALPSARVVYVSATGATKVSNLSYANRLGLWQTGDFPFTSREDFVESIEVGGIAAMEVVARDLKALGLYLARSLSFEGVEYDTLEIDLTPTQSRIYDSYADAFQIIHNNLHKALEACNISGAKTYNRMAKMSAMSQFESHKQRFFNHLLTGMKCPKLIKAIEQDIAIGHAVVIQIVSTNEELLKRKLYGIPTEEWKDLNLDLTPREYMMDYLMSRFTQVPLGTFEEMTGLSLTSTEGGMKIDLPPLRQFLNRLLALRIRMQNVIFERFELLLSQQIETAIAHGIFEVGVETLRAERFTVASTESVYTHPGTGSVTNYLKIERVQKTDIKTAAEAVEFATNYQGRLMVNSKSGNAAVCIPTHSIFDDQGGVVPRVLLVRPQKETRVPQDKLQASEWKQVSTCEFVAAWSKEVDELPKFTTDYIHLVTGILLPIWKTLPCQNSRVFRLQLSNGEKVLGRVVNAENIRQVAEQLGMKNKLLSPEELVHLVLNERYSEQLPGGVTLRCSTIASERRIELVNALSLADRLVTVGCFTEIIQWRKRVFIPSNEKAPAILAAVIKILG